MQFRQITSESLEMASNHEWLWNLPKVENSGTKCEGKYPPQNQLVVFLLGRYSLHGDVGK